MKRIAMIVILCLLLAGCTPDHVQGETTCTVPHTTTTPEEPIPQGPMGSYDAQNQYRGASSRILSFQETEGYFCGSGLMGEAIFYYDKATGGSGVLCADPSCTHGSSDCGAYADYGSFFCSNQGVCYWMAPENPGGYRDDCLWMGELSGLNQQIVKQFDFEQVIVAYNPQLYEIHRGRLYMLGVKDMLEGVSTIQRVTLVSTLLDDSEELTMLYEENFSQNVHPSVRFVGDYIYLELQVFPTGGPYDITLLKINTRTGQTQIVYEEKGMAESIGSLWVTGQGEVYIPGRNDSNANLWKLEDGKRQEVYRWGFPDPSTPNVFDGIAVFPYRVEGVRCIDIVDLSGQLLYSGQMFPQGIPGIEGDPNEYSLVLIGGDTQKLILNLQNFSKAGLTDYTIMLELESYLKPTILWSNQQ